MAEPLVGITVVEMTVAVQGPAAGLYLRDMGADVIKVEPPIGDPSRYGRGRFNETPDGTLGPQFVAVNRGKRSVCLDMATDGGARALFSLLENADVFLTNYREAALVRMGLGYDALHEKFPRLIYASVNGFGSKGEDSEKAMLDGAAAARGGLVHHTGYADREAVLPGAILVDTSGAMQLALGVMTALFVRERQGVVQRVQTSALGTALWLQQWELTHVAMTGADLVRSGSHHPNIRGPYGVYRTRDGGAIMLAQTMDQESWDALCVFGESPDLAVESRLQSPGQRLGEGLTEADSVELRERVAAMFAHKTALEWDDFLRTLPEVIWERVRSWQEVLDDPQSHANDYMTTVEIPGIGKKQTVGTLVKLSETPGSPKGNPPLLGEANDEILASLGFTESERRQVETDATRAREALLAQLLAARASAEDD